jgi:hypothetical protein
MKSKQCPSYIRFLLQDAIEAIKPLNKAKEEEIQPRKTVSRLHMTDEEKRLHVNALQRRRYHQKRAKKKEEPADAPTLSNADMSWKN